MKIGISTFVNDDSIDTVSLARAIEERGFESLVVAEHTHIPASRESGPNCKPTCASKTAARRESARRRILWIE